MLLDFKNMAVNKTQQKVQKIKIWKCPPKIEEKKKQEKISDPFQITGILERENRENITEENVPELKQMSPRLGVLTELPTQHNQAHHCEPPDQEQTFHRPQERKDI